MSTNSGSFSLVQGVDNPVDCCAACQRGTDCRGSFVLDARCHHVVGGTCEAGAFQGDGFTTLNGQDPGFAVSNGPCGAIANAGNQVPT